jgi:hypothetical protein
VQPLSRSDLEDTRARAPMEIMMPGHQGIFVYFACSL